MQAKPNQETGSEMKTTGLLFPHQRFKDHPIGEKVDAVLLMEEDPFLPQCAFPKQKITFHRASMKACNRSEGTKNASWHRHHQVDI
jgi:deoxyribodipyrimidine photolyase-related protein